MLPIVTLTTDFGDSPYVGQLKGVLLQGIPDCQIIDITHAIRPQDIVMGALALADSVPHFPDGSIHIAVVDPGVGTHRPIAVAQIGAWFVIGPDNGLLTELAREWPLRRLIHVDLERYPFDRSGISATFHGRDIMAPIATRIAQREPIVQFGLEVAALHPNLIPEPITSGRLIHGQVISEDSFGNLITNIRTKHLLRSSSPPQVRLIPSGSPVLWVNTYGEANHGTLVALAGSSGRIELSIVNGSASKVLWDGSTELEITC